MSAFESIPLAPPNAILGISVQCRNDVNPNKIDLTIGAYRTNEGVPKVLDVVRKAEKIVFEQNHYHEYLTQDGEPTFVRSAQYLMFGHESAALNEGRVASIQAISGTGALRLGAELISMNMRNRMCFIPSVTWQNHPAILDRAGVIKGTYTYLDSTASYFDFDSMVNDLNIIPDESIVLMHACAHNPSGFDPSQQQWNSLLSIFQRKKLLPFFDNAYQGFVSGSTDVDAYAVRLFMNAGMEMFVACSFSKNFGLYGERVGCLHVVTSSSSSVPNVMSQLRVLSRPIYSTCPSYGARLVGTILSDPILRQEWEQECKEMAERLLDVRAMFYRGLLEAGVKGSWERLIEQKGMFSFSGISAEAVERLKREHSIYMLSDGRISLSGLNRTNIPQFIRALADVLGTNEQ